MMKISYRTHPVLEKLASKKLGKLDVIKEDCDGAMRQRSWVSKKFTSISQNKFKNYVLAAPLRRCVCSINR